MKKQQKMTAKEMKILRTAMTNCQRDVFDILWNRSGNWCTYKRDLDSASGNAKARMQEIRELIGYARIEERRTPLTNRHGKTVYIKEFKLI